MFVENDCHKTKEKGSFGKNSVLIWCFYLGYKEIMFYVCLKTNQKFNIWKGWLNTCLKLNCSLILSAPICKPIALIIHCFLNCVVLLNPSCWKDNFKLINIISGTLILQRRGWFFTFFCLINLFQTTLFFKTNDYFLYHCRKQSICQSVMNMYFLKQQQYVFLTLYSNNFFTFFHFKQ